MALLGYPSQLREAARPYVRLLLGFSLAINLLMLVSPIYMLQVYDRILTTGSFETLGWLTLLALFLLAIYGLAEASRRRVFALGSTTLGERIGPAIFARFLDERAPPQLGRDLADLNRIQSALRGGSLSPLFDLPFAPLYLAALFWVHWMLGLVAIGGAAVLVIGAIVGQRRGEAIANDADALEANARDFAAGIERQRSAMLAMGMADRMAARLDARRVAALGSSVNASAIQGVTSAFSRSLRQGLQVLVLGIGAFYAVAGEVSAGAIVAGSILMGRLLMPVDQIVGSWTQLHAIRAAWHRIAPLLERSSDSATTALPRPAATIDLRDLSVRAGEEGPELVQPASLVLEGGALIGLVGANGAGKTSLLQTMAGLWRPASGEMFFGGRSIHDWPSADRGQYVGYLPQHIELLPGTVAQNIARFDENAGESAIIAAARAAGAHLAILGLPDGYDSVLGAGGVVLSAGQAQLIGLARALYRAPPFILLDEPGAHLDSNASQALLESLSARRDAGDLVLASTHDPAFLRRCDAVLVIANRRLSKVRPEMLVAAPAVDAHQKEMSA